MLLDIELGRGMDGFQTLEAIRSIYPDLPVVMNSKREDVATVVRAMRQGASDYIGKSFSRDELLLKVKRAIQHRHLAEEPGFLRGEVRERISRLVGDSRSMRAVRRAVERSAAAPSGVLITGESGTGKKLVARDIHDLSECAAKPFVPVDCATLPEPLFESMLFGHQRGAFTGADRSHRGRIELADGGTLFFDEIAELPRVTQSKLLRVIQERRFLRLGSSRERDLEARLIAATNRDIEKEVEDGRFRSDLYYRLNVLRIHIPPLRERLDDLASLTAFILQKKAQELKRPVPHMTAEAMQLLLSWQWPGNVRELENVLENAMVNSAGDRLQPEDFSSIQHLQPMAADFATARKAVMERFERQYLGTTLRSCHGNISKTARRLGLSRCGLQKILKRLGMHNGSERISGEM